MKPGEVVWEFLEAETKGLLHVQGQTGLHKEFQVSLDYKVKLCHMKKGEGLATQLNW